MSISHVQICKILPAPFSTDEIGAIRLSLPIVIAIYISLGVLRPGSIHGSIPAQIPGSGREKCINNLFS